MKSFGSYGLNKIPQKVIFGFFFIFVLTPLISLILKVSGVITNAEPIIMSTFGAISVASLMLGIYMLKEALLIRRSFIVTKAEVIENLMSIAGRAIKIKFTHNHDQMVAAALLTHGYKRKGSRLTVLFDPNQPSTVYLYGFKYYFVPAIPVILGCVFAVLVIRYING